MRIWNTPRAELDGLAASGTNLDSASAMATITGASGKASSILHFAVSQGVVSRATSGRGALAVAVCEKKRIPTASNAVKRLISVRLKRPNYRISPLCGSDQRPPGNAIQEFYS